MPSVGRLLPTAATDALIGQQHEHLVPPAAGGALLVAWGAGLAIVGLGLTARRDGN